jgi:hypothetical protein
MYRETYSDGGSRLKRTAAVVGLVALVVLGIIVSRRLSSDAIGVLLGVAAGVGASIPTALLLMAVTRRQEDEPERRYRDEPRQSVPPVIVVAPGSVPQMMGQYSGTSPQQLPPPSGRRQFRVMGYDEEDAQTAEADQRARLWYE